jgi:hypothetical protein
MTWPTTQTTSSLDADTDTLQNARPEVKGLADKFNLLVAHVTTFMQGLLGSADAATARTTLDVPSRNGGGATGTWGVSITGSAASATDATNCSRSVTGAGLASGGGALAADRVITVTKATQAQAEAGTDDATAMTPLRTAQAIAVLANPLPAIAAAPVGAVGTFAMLRFGGDAAAGALVAGSSLFYASVNSSGVAFSGSPDGTWMLCGYTQNSRASVWKRVS